MPCPIIWAGRFLITLFISVFRGLALGCCGALTVAVAGCAVAVADYVVAELAAGYAANCPSVLPHRRAELH